MSSWYESRRSIDVVDRQASGFVEQVLDAAREGRDLPDSAAVRVLEGPALELLPMLDAARAVKHARFGDRVQVGFRGDGAEALGLLDCRVCSRAAGGSAWPPDPTGPARDARPGAALVARAAGTRRVCLARHRADLENGRGEELAAQVARLRREGAVEVCLSAGGLDAGSAARLGEAGLDRYHQDLITGSERHVRLGAGREYSGRVGALTAARAAGIPLCSGVAVGLGETLADVVEVARMLRWLEVRTLPVSFHHAMAMEGSDDTRPLDGDLGLRILCLFRFLLPWAEIRVLSGAEFYFQGMEPLVLFAANGLRAAPREGTTGAEQVRRALRAAGFGGEGLEGTGA